MQLTDEAIVASGIGIPEAAIRSGVGYGSSARRDATQRPAVHVSGLNRCSVNNKDNQ